MAYKLPPTPKNVDEMTFESATFQGAPVRVFFEYFEASGADPETVIIEWLCVGTVQLLDHVRKSTIRDLREEIISIIRRQRAEAAHQAAINRQEELAMYAGVF